MPDLQNRGYSLVRIDKLNSFVDLPLKNKGDFQYEYRGLFHDTKYNRKLYAYVFYLDEMKNEKRVTAKIYCDILGFPIKTEYRPNL